MENSLYILRHAGVSSTQKYLTRGDFIFIFWNNFEDNTRRRDQYKKFRTKIQEFSFKTNLTLDCTFSYMHKNCCCMLLSNILDIYQKKK